MEKNTEGNKVLLIYNPRAGSGMFPANLDKIIEAFQSGEGRRNCWTKYFGGLIRMTTAK